VNIRHATLTNETANLTDEERRKMENGHARAAIRLALLCRQRSVEEALRKHNPKLLSDA